VAKEINSNALIKKHESTVSDLSLSLSSLSTVSKPLPSMSSSASSPVALSEISVTEEVVKNKFNKNIAKSDAYDDHKIDKLEADDDDTTLFITESNEMVKHHSDLNEINESSLSEEESVRDLELFFINPVFFLYSNID